MQGRGGSGAVRAGAGVRGAGGASSRGAFAFALAFALGAVGALLAPRVCVAQPAPAPRRRLSLAGPYEPRYRGGWLFDHGVRSSLRARSPQGRRAADEVSDALLALSVAGPWAASTILGLSHERNWRAAGELALVDAEGLVLTLVVAEGFKLLTGRERPYATDENLAALCREPGRERDPRCDGGRNASFLSGHSSTSFASAGLLCAQTAYASAPGDAGAFVACGAAMAFAASTAALRIVADKHHATDVLAGMVLGLSTGLAVPMLLHFADGAPLPVATALSPGAHDYGPMLASVAAGIALGGAVPVLAGLAHGPAGGGAAALRFWFGPVAMPGGAGAGAGGVF